MLDPKFSPSKTEKRAQVAESRIPRLTEELIGGQRELNQRNLELLYGELRAYFKGNGGFRSEISRCGPSVEVVSKFEDYSSLHLLEFLSDLPRLNSADAVAALYCLYAEVTIEPRKRSYALT